MLSQKGPQFVLKSYFAMMLFLAANIFLHDIKIRLAHRKIGVSTLPMEIVKLPTLLLEPDT